MPTPEPEATTLSLERYAPDAKALVAAAQSLADERKHAEVQPLHLLLRALGRDLGVRAVFERGVSNLLEFEAALERALGNLPRSAEPAYLSASMLDLLERAQREADFIRRCFSRFHSRFFSVSRLSAFCLPRPRPISHLTRPSL